MSRVAPRGMKLQTVSLWLLLLLSERPMYGYEIIRELEKRFSGFWKPKTGTIYPALERLEKGKLVTSRIEFMGEVPDRKHYALTDQGRAQLSESMAHWTRVTELLENYKEAHRSISRYKVETGRAEVAEILTRMGSAMGRGTIVTSDLFSADKPAKISPSDRLRFKFFYAKENHKLEMHMEIEWVPDRPSKKDISQ